MRRYRPAFAVSLLFIAWSPFIGQLRDVVKRVPGDSFALVIGLLLDTTVLAAGRWGVQHLRERRPQRIGLMSAANTSCDTGGS